MRGIIFFVPAVFGFTLSAQSQPATDSLVERGYTQELYPLCIDAPAFGKRVTHG